MSPAIVGPLPGSNNPSLLGQQVRNLRASAGRKIGMLILMGFLIERQDVARTRDDETVAAPTMRRQRVCDAK
jgi:hypothetical protein